MMTKYRVPVTAVTCVCVRDGSHFQSFPGHNVAYDNVLGANGNRE